MNLMYTWKRERKSLRLRLITANFGLDSSSYRAQPHPIIVNYKILYYYALSQQY